MKNRIKIVELIAHTYGAPLPVEEVQVLASVLEYKELRKGEILLSQGSVAREVIYVASGMIRQFYYKKGIDITEHFTCERATLAYCIASLFKKEPTNLQIEALENSVLYTLSYEKLKELSLGFPVIALFHFSILESALIVSQQKADS